MARGLAAEVVQAAPACRFEAGRALDVRHLDGGPTLAVVSIAWLAGRGETGQAALAGRHLSLDEQDHRASLRIRKRRVEWLAGRLAVKCGVRAYQRRHGGVPATPARDLLVRRVGGGPRAGKPYLDLPVEIGLSHAGDFAVAACGPRPLGIDLEPAREMTPYLTDLLAVPAGPPGDDAHRRLHTMPHPLRWACREAVLKFYGVGLRLGGPRQVELTGWHPDGSFTWRPAPELRHYCSRAAEPPPRTCLATEIDGYSMAMVWR